MTTDTEIKTRLDRAMARHGRLREQKIGAERDLVRSTEEVDRTRTRILERFGTDDPLKIGEMIEAARRENLAAVEAFENALDEVEKNLDGIERG
jgi:hypothetical protein